MTKHMTGTRRSGWQRGSSCSRRRRSSRGAATSWRGGGRSCRGSGSTRSIDSRPTRERLAGGPLPRALAAPRLPLHVRARLHGGCPSCSAIADGFDGFAVTWPTTTSCCGRCRGAAREAAGVQAADGVDVPWASSLGGDFNCRLQRLASPRSNSARGGTNTTTERGAVQVKPARPVDRGGFRPEPDRRRTRAERPGNQRVRARNAWSTTPYPRIPRGVTVLGAFTCARPRHPRGRNRDRPLVAFPTTNTTRG
jgi:predicted dithiol-disulfide oxidoreductase (DUF899 family)